MKLQFDIGKQEKTRLIIKRNWFTGKFTYTENGIQQTIRSALHPSTHFNVRLTKYYLFEVGTKVETPHRNKTYKTAIGCGI